MIADPIQPLSRQGMDESHQAQTSDIAGEVFPLILKEEREDLSPNAAADKIIVDLENIRNDLLIVSHLPFIPNLLARLIPGQNFPRSIGTASVIILKKTDKGWELLEVITPQSL